MSSKAYHPLRKLIISGNPNKTKKSTTLCMRPLELYLDQHKINYQAFQRFQDDISCEIVTPFSPDYAKAKKESDNAFNKCPLMIVYCTCANDVIKCIKFCHDQNISVCARAGGHSTAGYSVLNDHLVIDVSRIQGIFIDPDKLEATVGSGITWGEFNYALDAYGLHTPGGSCNGVGITGFTLGGGYGYTSVKWGVACDNLLEVTIVTAKGDIITANEHINADLLWAHRGGTGGNFGIVVSLKYRLYPLKLVWPIAVNWPIDDAAKVLVTWQDTMTKTLSDTNIGLLGFLATNQLNKTSADGERITYNVPYFCVRGIYSGSAQDGAKALEPLLNIGNPTYPSGKLWQNQVNYTNANLHLLDNVEGIIPDTIKETKRCSYIEKALTESDYQKMVDYFKTSPNLYNIVSMEPYGGAINAKATDATAFFHRNAYFDIFVDSFWMEEEEKSEAFQWLNDYFESDTMKDLWTNHYYQNYPNSKYQNWQQGYFGDNYETLKKIKLKWDPENFFQYEQSIELPD